MINIPLKSPHYAYDEWEVVENRFTVENNARNETAFALGNGYFGMRGTFEEGYSGPGWPGVEGTYINGFYETAIIKYPEIAYGYAEKSQTMLNVANCKIIKLVVDGEEFSMLEGKVSDYQRSVSFKEGILQRRLIWTSPRGKKVAIHIERMISLAHQHWALIRYEVKPLNFNGTIQFMTAIDGDVTNLSAEKDPRVGSGLQGRVLSVSNILGDGEFGLIVQKTQNSGLTLASAMINQMETGNRYTIQNQTEEFSVQAVYEVHAALDVPVILTKYIAVVTSLDRAVEPTVQPLDETIEARAKQEVWKARETGYAGMKQLQLDFLRDFWFQSHVDIKGEPAILQAIRFNMFHLLQSVGRNGRTNIAAKGLTGEGYEGHYFWDSETYILPFFLCTFPEIGRKLLEYRYNLLPQARERARQMSHPKGALFPWRTINGEECSAYFPGGTAQYHINADIAFAVKKYVETTADHDFLIHYGAELLFETARLWADLGAFIPGRGNLFCINEVTGPDEYSALVNNNCYTNLMAKENLEYACQVALWMKENAADEYQKLAAKIGLEEGELEAWGKAATEMCIPYDPGLKIHLQDDDFLNRVPWDFSHTRPEQYPLLMHFHPLVIYRHQVCKQADLVLALFLLGDQFSKEQKQRDFDFYEKITTHDSSLSSSIFSIVATEIGYFDKGYQYFLKTVRTDLDDIQGNTKDGIHAASMAGSWMCLAYGFAGMRVHQGTISFHPVLPEGWQEYSFRINFRGNILEVGVDPNGASFHLLKGEPLTLECDGQKCNLVEEQQIPVGCQ
ncbi:MAG TPA: family 65 glycosyl hydrolase [Firmicutes bacterium]|nr:family 65 glycosyl hydrolase [Bacillota bacterium]